MEENNNFIIELPTNPNKNLNKTKKTNQEVNNVEALKDSIKAQYDEINSFQDLEITQTNIYGVERIIFATEDLISNCIDDSLYCGNEDQNFINLIYICHKISLRMETYKLENKIQDLTDKSKDISKIQEKLENQQIKIEEQNNNLVYNLLGFLTSFSIVSAVVGVVAQIQGIVNLMIFMTFTLLLVLTTLIALHNFYKNENKREKKLQDNYFLWKMLGIVLIILIIISGIKYASNNKTNIKEYIDNKIENCIEKRINEKELENEIHPKY